jgi:hypothetical protein
MKEEADEAYENSISSILYLALSEAAHENT